MIKNGKIEIGKTPSEVSGKPCTLIKKGSPIVDGEENDHHDIVNEVYDEISDMVLRIDSKLDDCLDETDPCCKTDKSCCGGKGE